MSGWPGRLVRRVLGPAVDPVIRRYRLFYVDLRSWGETMATLDGVGSILEIGCGDGHLCEVLATAFPDAEVLGIDIAEDPGRLYGGRHDGVEFRRQTAEELADTGAVFDLVVLCDVIHHVSPEKQGSLVETAWGMVAPSGYLAVKDWVRGPDMASRFAYLSDRYVTGDIPNFFDSDDAFIELIEGQCTGGENVGSGWVPPRANNRYLFRRRPGIVA
jgi:2-polyprenyl-6-hydroxyphenyl methylase/3-demethylubiquinone-9 3-methyltransferase